VPAVRAMFRARDLFFHDGATMRRVHLSTKLQASAAAGSALVMSMALASTVQFAVGAPAMANAIGQAMSRDAAIERMNAKVVSMEAEMAAIRTAAATHAKRLEVRQAMLDAMITGEGRVPSVMPAAARQIDDKAAPLVAPLASAEAKQTAMAARLTAMHNARYAEATAAIGKVGLNTQRFFKVEGAMGGPYEPLPATGDPAAKVAPDPQFRALFQSWKRLEQLQQGIVAIPSHKPTEAVSFTSGFGVRSDPFRGGAAMHAGVDIPGPVGTPIYATADGVVGRAQWANGYGWLVELNHGRGIQTRYGHLSVMLVKPGEAVKRGQLIARMGSTGRSTGSHLHYEVRLDGHAVNPMPFLQSTNYLMAMQERARGSRVAMGGPAAAK